ncbi:pirin family protein [Henriciella aquimarina]|uniref:pirin family protein n=1 Tax=Henriciella aquimarina TaxID=545261 RepID=UPI000A05047B|nr:pirin family protein [Henriciella aquimarina]
MTERHLKAAHAAYRDDIADLVTRRPLPGPGVRQVDPFLFLNHHGPQTYPPGSNGLPFGPHPHRGFETVTFILEGSLAHMDTGGHESVIHAGGVQWMTAGSGLVHAELSPEDFKRDGGDMEILQLWVNLPSQLKMTTPRYTGVQAADIPAIAAGDGATVHLVSGDFEGQTGPVDSLTDVFMSMVSLPKGAKVTLPAPERRNVFFYVVRGTVTAGGETVEALHLGEFGPDGDTVEVTASEDAFLLYGHAEPTDEPVVARGPFVMNTEAEIRDAIADYQAGKFDRAPETLKG